MISKLKCTIVALGMLFVGSLSAQQVQVGASIDSTSILIGEQTMIHLDAKVSDGMEISFPQLADTIVGGVEVLAVNPIDTLGLENGILSLRQNVLITSFDSALYYIPPFKFTTLKDTVETNSLVLKVMTMPVDVESKQFFDVKPVLTVPFVFADYRVQVLTILCLLWVLVMGAYAYQRWRRNRLLGGVAVESRKPLLPPAQEARIALGKLKESQLWQRGLEKEYYTTLTDILRNYVHRRYGVNAMEMTTSEILFSIKNELDIKDVLPKLRSVLELSDFVKFAKYTPLADENTQSYIYAESFVDSTEEKVVEEPAEAKDEVEPKTGNV